MNTLADCAMARHGAEVASASITLQLTLAAPRHGAQPPPPGRRCERIRPSLITLTLMLHSDSLHAEVRDGSGILPVQRSAGREDDCGRGLATIDVLAEYWTSGRAPGGGKWVRACMSRGNGLFDGGR